MTSKLLTFCREAVRFRGPMLVEQLFHSLSAEFPDETSTSICKTASDLATFLKMHADVFEIKANFVALCANAHAKPPPPLLKGDSEERPRYVNGGGAEEPIVSQTRNQSLKQRINSLLMKTLAENTERDRSYQAATVGNHDGWKSKLLQAAKVIVNSKECSCIVEEVLRSNERVVSFDCEGVNVGPKGQVTLFQVGTARETVYLFDIVTCPLLITHGGLQRLLEAENVIKVTMLINWYWDTKWLKMWWRKFVLLRR